MSARYRLWWIKCWGGTRVWDIREQVNGRMVSAIAREPFKTERAAQRLCDRMNADWQRFLDARDARFYTGPVAPRARGEPQPSLGL